MFSGSSYRHVRQLFIGRNVNHFVFVNIFDKNNFLIFVQIFRGCKEFRICEIHSKHYIEFGYWDRILSTKAWFGLCSAKDTFDTVRASNVIVLPCHSNSGPVTVTAP